MTDALKTALEALFKQIVDFVKAIFAKEVGNVEDLIK